MKYLFFLLLITISCKKQDTSSNPITYTIGQSVGGGKVFYIDGTGEHGLIGALNDQSISPEFWDVGSHIQTNATSSTDGLANTNTIISVIGNSGTYAAKICKDYRGGGFSDWFLPSYDQLQTMYTQRITVFGGGFSYNYWSSTEASPIYNNVIGFDFQNGVQLIQNRFAKSWVRAIRAF